ncbi:integrase core domain-containing protein [Streptomyces microflavus]
MVTLLLVIDASSMIGSYTERFTVPSKGAVGTSADNAAWESFHASLKRETLQSAHDYGDATTCRRTVLAWLTRYNTRRQHSTNSYLSPDQYERRHHTAKLTLAA